VIAALCFAEQIMSVLTFHSYCSIWKDFGTTGLHVKLVCVWDCENLGRRKYFANGK
jgi:hypothetical protein